MEEFEVESSVFHVYSYDHHLMTAMVCTLLYPGSLLSYDVMSCFSPGLECCFGLIKSWFSPVSVLISVVICTYSNPTLVFPKL